MKELDEIMAKKAITLVKDIEVVEVVQEDGTIEKQQKLVTEDYPYPIFVKGGLVKKAIDLGVKMEKSGEENIDSSVIDDLADFAVELYGKQFKRNELIDGIEATELFDTLTGILSSVMGGDEGNEQTKKFITEKKL